MFKLKDYFAIKSTESRLHEFGRDIKSTESRLHELGRDIKSTESRLQLNCTLCLV